MRKAKKASPGKYVYIIGTIVLALMFIIVAFNFSKDARIFEKPLLSSDSAAKKDAKSGNAGDYRTLKYKKPISDKKTGAGNKTGTSLNKGVTGNNTDANGKKAGSGIGASISGISKTEQGKASENTGNNP